jgi:hypothetical protein
MNRDARRRLSFTSMCLVFLVIGVLLPVRQPAEGLAACQPYAVIGFNDLSVDEWAKITGEIAGTQTVTVGKATVIAHGPFNPNAVSGNLVSLGESVIVDGNLRANGVRIGRDVLINGTTGPPPDPIDPLPIFPVITGAQRVFVPKGADMVLGPGAYFSIETAEWATIHFTGGTYSLAEMRIGKATKLYFSAPTTINVRDVLQLGENVQISIGTTSAPPNINFQGVNDVQFGKGVQAVLALVAPKALIQLGQGGEYVGRIWGQRVQVGPAVEILGASCGPPA